MSAKATRLSVSDKLEYVTYGYIRENVEAKVKDIIPEEIKLLISSFLSNLWMDSTILTPKEKDMLISMVEGNKITSKFKGCEWKLLIRASRDGYEPADFHKLCDGKQDTVCFVETEHNHIAGGYVELEWGQSQFDWSQSCDNAYMFVVRPTQKIFEKNPPEKAIMERKCTVMHWEGDCFSFGYENLYLSQNKRGYCHPKKHFNFDNSKEVAGSTSFRVIDYEVFQLLLE